MLDVALAEQLPYRLKTVAGIKIYGRQLRVQVNSLISMFGQDIGQYGF